MRIYKPEEFLLNHFSNMYALLLLLLFTCNTNGLLCVRNGTYKNEIGKFTDELFKLANTTVNNSRIGKCCVNIELTLSDQTMKISYHGDTILDTMCDSINLHIEFMFFQNYIVLSLR